MQSSRGIAYSLFRVEIRRDKLFSFLLWQFTPAYRRSFRKGSAKAVKGVVFNIGMNINKPLFNVRRLIVFLHNVGITLFKVKTSDKFKLTAD